MDEFFQDGPVLDNQFESDRLLRSYLRRRLPREAYEKVDSDLTRFAHRLLTDIPAMAEDAQRNEPRLVQYDPWGRRIDRIEVSEGWRQLDRVSAEEGMVAIGYERALGSLSRLHQFAKLYLFNPSSAIYTCPLAMTDGAARAIEVHGDEALRQGAYQRLITRDPTRFWTSGQWMTERSGGSDVGQSETVARRQDDGFRLYGTKWFTSATTSQMAMTLARIEDESGTSTPGSRGLSLFYLETRDHQGRLNGIRIHRLKDKLGTRALPTAELTLESTLARLVGRPGRGVANITSLVNVKRVYNAISAVALMRRGLALARDYAHRRRAFGKLLCEHPLHVETLGRLEVQFQAAFHLAFHCVLLMGRVECDQSADEAAVVLRLLTPLAKLTTGKQSVAAASETLELFGGAGYVEDTGLPQLLREAQVLPIWEGTTNILSLDTLRAIEKDRAFEPFLRYMRERLNSVSHAELAGAKETALQAFDEIEAFLPKALSDGRAAIETTARDFALSLARTTAAALMLEHAQWSLENEQDHRDAIAARRWCAEGLTSLFVANPRHRDESRSLGLDEPLHENQPAVPQNGASPAPQTTA